MILIPESGYDVVKSQGHLGNAGLINEARGLRRLMMRHPPSNNQRTLALFLAEGHYDALIRRLHGVYRERWEAMGRALVAYLPGCSRTPHLRWNQLLVEGTRQA